MNNSRGSALSPEVRELLTVIRDALDLPYGAAAEDAQKRRELRVNRVLCTVATLSYGLGEPSATVEEMTGWLRTQIGGCPIDYLMKFKVAARPWERGWELHIPDVGVTQSAPNATDAEAMARDYIALERDLPLDAFQVVIDTTEVDS
ncbi:hypothetical protein AB0C69_28505 [Actinomadura sp. NPDC048032]|uniref:hypothetical protein n=1 Tax=Actinomadura sp. NPDC048032 TaxID=3155747 RepID=UPI00340547ED